jgi:hypothetical protein
VHLGGFGVAPDGTIVAACINTRDPKERQRVKAKKLNQDEGKARQAPDTEGRC